METRKFVNSLEEVSEHFGTAVSVVRHWRDKRHCQYLISRPYDIGAISKWLDESADIEINIEKKLRIEKLQSEIDALKSKNDVFGKDKTFWLAAAALGITVSREVRLWMDESNTESAGVSSHWQARMFVGRGQHEHLLRIANQRGLPLSGLVGNILSHAVENQNLYTEPLRAPIQRGIKISTRVKFKVYKDLSSWARDVNRARFAHNAYILQKYLEHYAKGMLHQF